MSDKKNIKLHILGGGPAGLAAGYFAKKKKIELEIFEASNQTGGNCKTIKYGEYRFDTGAHRFHDKNDEVTSEIKSLVGEDFLKVAVPSKIFKNKTKFREKSLHFLFAIKTGQISIGPMWQLCNTNS